MKLELTKYKQDLFSKSIIWNSIIEVFQSEKNINITKYLVSIKIKWLIFLVKTDNPLINAELLNLDDKIKEVFMKKIKKTWIKIEKLEIRYI
jgi:hypothetical protein